jgi:predicted permease
LFAQLIFILFPVVTCALIGFLWKKNKRPFDTDTIGQLVMTISSPCLVISTLSKTHLNNELFGQMAQYTLIVVAVTLVVGIICVRAHALPMRVYLPSMVFVNTGNMGLPLCLFAFGEQGLAYGIVFFMVMTVLHFSLGLAMVSGEGVFKTLLTNPLVHSVWVAIILQLTHWKLPLWLSNTIDLLGQFAIPLMLIALGASLASLAVKNVMISLKFSFVRVLGGCAIAWVICEIFNIEGVMRGVLILQSSMPAAVFNYLIADRYRRDPQAVAGIVVASTLIAFFALPGILWLVL